MKGQVTVFLDTHDGNKKGGAKTPDQLEKERLKEAKLANRQDLHSRERLLEEVRSRPDLVQQFGFIQAPSNLEILRKFKGVEDPRDLLRDRGVEPDEAFEISELVPGALRAVPPEAACSCFKKPGRMSLAVAGALLLLTAILLGLFFWLPISYKDGYKEATCNILEYYGRTCFGSNCTFNIDIREAESEDGGFKMLVIKDWPMPVERNAVNEQVKLSASAFACCNPGGDLNCCNMFDEESIVFCDNMPHLDDPEGQPCPEGDWPCLFKSTKGADGLEVPTELIASEPPFVLPLLVCAILSFVSSLSAAIFGYCKKTLCCGMGGTIARFRASAGRAVRRKSALEDMNDGYENRRVSALEDLKAKPTPAKEEWVMQDSSRQDAPNTSSNVAIPAVAARSGLNLDEEEPPKPPDIEFPNEPNEPPPQLGSEELQQAPKMTRAEAARQERASMANMLTRSSARGPGSKQEDVHPAFAHGDLSSFVADPTNSIKEAMLSIIEPLPKVVASRYSREVRRQNSAPTRQRRPASAPGGRVGPASAGAGGAWLAANSPDIGRHPESAGASLQRPESAGGKRPDSAASKIPESVVSTSAPSRRASPESSGWSESGTSYRPDSAPSTRPQSGKNSRPESGLSKARDAPVFIKARPESGTSKRPTSAAQTVQLRASLS